MEKKLMNVKCDWENRRLRPRVGITGSFGRGNYGDELYVQVYEKYLGPWADLLLMTGLTRPKYFSNFHKNLVDTVDAIVLGGGDLLCPYRESIDMDFINPIYLRKPVHIAGIGVENNKPIILEGTLDRWRKFLTDKNIASISTRDPSSKSWIEENIGPNVNLSYHPDWACALPLPNITPDGGSPILGIVTRHIKSPAEYKLIIKAGRELLEKGWRVQHIIAGVGAHGKKDYENSLHVDIPGKETIYTESIDEITAALGKCSLLLSMKLHTTIIGTMFGVPTICLNPVVKAREFMQAAGCSDRVFSANDPSALDLIRSGVNPPPTSNVSNLRQGAEIALANLSNRIWHDFRARSDFRLKNLPDNVTD